MLPSFSRQECVSGSIQIELTRAGSFQLTMLGMKAILHRLELDMIDRSCSGHVMATVFKTALTAASEIVQFVMELSSTDRAMFWMPCASNSSDQTTVLRSSDTFHHMSNAGSLLLRIATETRQLEPVLCTQAVDLAKMYCQSLASYWRDEQWDMADETLKRLAEPAFTVGRDCYGAREIYLTISNALGYHVAGMLKGRRVQWGFSLTARYRLG